MWGFPTLSLPRRFISDLMAFCRNVPTVVAQRRMALGAVAEARRACPIRLSWSVLFAKALALVATRRRELRRAYLPVPWPRLYEHPDSVAAIAVERHLDGEEIVLTALQQCPERCLLADFQAHLQLCKEAPVWEIGSYRRVLRVSRLPRPLRRLLWWIGLNVSGRLRAKTFGTFGLTSTGAQGAGLVIIRSPLTATLHFGMFDEGSNLDVFLTFDHRVFDGAQAARVLVDLEQTLKGEIVDELRQLSCCQAA
jgi:hypothetical protein